MGRLGHRALPFYILLFAGGEKIGVTESLLFITILRFLPSNLEMIFMSKAKSVSVEQSHYSYDNYQGGKNSDTYPHFQ